MTKEDKLELVFDERLNKVFEECGGIVVNGKTFIPTSESYNYAIEADILEFVIRKFYSLGMDNVETFNNIVDYIVDLAERMEDHQLMNWKYYFELFQSYLEDYIEEE
jgi:hypothetical protein